MAECRENRPRLKVAVEVPVSWRRRAGCGWQWRGGMEAEEPQESRHASCWRLVGDVVKLAVTRG